MEGDLLVIVIPQNDPSSSAFASALPITLSPIDGRPIVGIYNLNFAGIEVNKLNEFLYFNIFAHEMTHILGFSNNLFSEFYYDGEKRSESSTVQDIHIGGTQYKAIILPEVVEIAKKHFNCDSITGLPLENNGGGGSANSHWEKTFLSSSYMNPVTEFPGILDPFTFAFLNGTGWYIVDGGAPQHMEWGLNSGCVYFKQCPNTKEYCTKDSLGIGCTADYMNIALCMNITVFSQTCSLKISNPSSYCPIGSSLPTPTANPKASRTFPSIYSLHSRCLITLTLPSRSSSLYTITPNCYPTYCTSSSGVPSLTILYSADSPPLTCSKSRALLPLSASGETVLLCPDLSDFCGVWSRRCLFDCSGNGLCLNGGKCYCFSGDPEDCSQDKLHTSNNTLIDVFVQKGRAPAQSRSPAAPLGRAGSGEAAQSALLLFLYWWL